MNKTYVIRLDVSINAEDYTSAEEAAVRLNESLEGDPITFVETVDIMEAQ